MKEILRRELRNLVILKQTERVWHIPVLAALSVGIPLLLGLYFGNLQAGLYGCLSGLVILYMPVSGPVAKRMVILLTCSFGFMVSFAVGLIFSFNPWVSSVAFGLFSVAVHWVSLYFKARPPGSFFFIMIASLASNHPFDLGAVPEKLGLIGLGTMVACILALVYSLFIAEKKGRETTKLSGVIEKNKYFDFVEALIMGLFMFGSLGLGYLLKIDNPYWIPTSCAAVMMGASRYHIWQRTFHRILGTFIGLGLCWLLLSVSSSPIYLCLSIIILQLIIEFLVVRQYALAVIFITPLTLFLAEAADPLIHDQNALFLARFTDISLGSLLGALGGWVLYHEKLRYFTQRRVMRNRENPKDRRK